MKNEEGGERMTEHGAERGQLDKNLPLVRAESNTEMHPIFKVTARNRDSEPYSYERVIRAEEGLELKKTWIVVPSGMYGCPAGSDQDVFVAVLELVERRGGMPPDGRIETSYTELLRILGKRDTAQNRRAVRESLMRIHFTGIESRDSFYSRETDSFITDTFRIWDAKIAENKRKSDGRVFYLIEITFHDVFKRSFLAHYLKGLDTEFFWSLTSYLSKRLYRLVDQMRGHEREWREDLFELQRQIPIGPYNYASKIKEKLDPAHAELEKGGFLEEVCYDDDGVYYRVSEAFARRRAAFELSGSPEEFIAIERLLAEGLRGDVARDLVAAHGARRCLLCADALSSRSGIRNRPGWLRKAIEENYDLGDPSLLPGAETSGPSEPEDLPVEHRPGRRPLSRPRSDPRAEELWDQVLEGVADEIDAPSWRVWFEGTVPVAIGDSALTISVPNSFAKQYIEGRFKQTLEENLRDLRGGEWALRIEVG